MQMDHEQMREFSERLDNADRQLRRMAKDSTVAHDSARRAHLASKAEGVRLAKSYLLEYFYK